MNDLGEMPFATQPDISGSFPQSEVQALDWAEEVLPYVDKPATKGTKERYFASGNNEIAQSFSSDSSPVTRATTVDIEGEPQYVPGIKEERVVQSWTIISSKESKPPRERKDFFYDQNGRLKCVRVVKETPEPLWEFGDQLDPQFTEELQRFDLYRYSDDGEMVAGASVLKKGATVRFGTERYASEASPSKVFLPHQSSHFYY